MRKWTAGRPLNDGAGRLLCGRCGRQGNFFQPPVEPTTLEAPGQHRYRGVTAENCGGHHDERKQCQTHHRTSVTPSNMSAGKWIPDVFRRSQTFGLTPVARNRPITLPSCVTPSFSNTKISCMVMISPSMPVLSEMLVTFLVPSLGRVC